MLFNFILIILYSPDILVISVLPMRKLLLKRILIIHKGHRAGTWDGRFSGGHCPALPLSTRVLSVCTLCSGCNTEDADLRLAGREDLRRGQDIETRAGLQEGNLDQGLWGDAESRAARRLRSSDRGVLPALSDAARRRLGPCPPLLVLLQNYFCWTELMDFSRFLSLGLRDTLGGKEKLNKNGQGM